MSFPFIPIFNKCIFIINCRIGCMSRNWNLILIFIMQKVNCYKSIRQNEMNKFSTQTLNKDSIKIQIVSHRSLVFFL